MTAERHYYSLCTTQFFVQAKKIKILRKKVALEFTLKVEMVKEIETESK